NLSIDVLGYSRFNAAANSPTAALIFPSARAISPLVASRNVGKATLYEQQSVVADLVTKARRQFEFAVDVEGFIVPIAHIVAFDVAERNVGFSAQGDLAGQAEVITN